jgi:hypothetical protein
MFNKISSSFILKKIFNFLDNKIKYNTVVHNKKLQIKLGLNLIDFRIFSGRYKIEEDGKTIEYNSYNNQIIFKGQYSNGKLNGNSLNFEIEKNFVELYNDNTFGYISVMERDNNEGQVEKRFDSYGKLGLLSDTVNAKFYFEYENDIPVLRIATYTDMNENSIKKRESVLNINNYDDIYFNIYAYKFGNDGKNLSYVDDTVEDKEIDKNLRKYTISLNEKTSNFKLRKATYYNNLDYYAKITLYDIYGNTNETRLVKINK